MRAPKVCLFLALGVLTAVQAQQSPSVKSIDLPADNALAELRPGPGVETARANCVVCHSTDYIVRQPRSDAKRWEGEVKKMVTVFGAPISEADAKVIVEYLATVYGPPEKPAAQPSKPTAALDKRKAPSSR